MTQKNYIVILNFKNPIFLLLFIHQNDFYQYQDSHCCDPLGIFFFFFVFFWLTGIRMYHISLIVNISMIIDIRDMGGLESQIMLSIYLCI